MTPLSPDHSGGYEWSFLNAMLGSGSTDCLVAAGNCRFGVNMPDGQKRYLEQVERVIMVLNNILEGKEYLVDDRL